MHSHRTRTLTTGTARGVRRGRPTAIAAVVVPAVALLAGTPTTALAPPPTDVTTTSSTTTMSPRIIAVPAATTTTTTTTTSPQVIAVPAATTTTTTTTTTSAPPAVQVATTSAATTAPVIAQQPPPTPATTAPAAPTDVAVSTTTTQPVQLGVPATAPPSTGEQVTIGEWSTDPADWSPEVLQYLQAGGLDPDALANQGATVGGPSDQLLSNEGCAVNCITSGLMWAVGVGAYLEVTTSVPAFIQIEILDVGLKFGPPSAKIWGATWAHLEPGTTYQAVARAHDAQGNMAVASGEFTTATRHATITFEPTVFWFGNVPDFDPWGSYLWSNHAYGYLNGTEQASATDTPHPTLSFDTGAIDPSVIEVAYVGVYDCVAGCEDISLWDIISAAFFGPPLQGAAPPLQEHAGGVLDDGFWGTVAAGIQLDGYPNDAKSWTGHEFTFPLSTFWGQPVGPPVYLTVNVTVKVSYKL